MNTKHIAIVCMLASTSLVFAGPVRIEREKEGPKVERPGAKLGEKERDNVDALKKRVEELNKVKAGKAPAKGAEPVTNRVSEEAAKTGSGSGVRVDHEGGSKAGSGKASTVTTPKFGGRGEVGKSAEEIGNEQVKLMGTKGSKVSTATKDLLIEKLAELKGEDSNFAASTEGKDFIELALDKLHEAEIASENGTVSPEMVDKIVELVQSFKYKPNGEKRTRTERIALAKYLTAGAGLQPGEMAKLSVKLAALGKEDAKAQEGAFKLATVYGEAYEKASKDGKPLSDQVKAGEEAIQEFIEGLKGKGTLSDKEIEALKKCCAEQGLHNVAMALGKFR